MILANIVASLLGLSIAWACIPIVLRHARRFSALRRGTDFHHTNKAPVPRYGGLALAAAFVGLELYLQVFQPVAGRTVATDRSLIILSSLAMFAIGFWDDVRPLGAKKKLFGQAAVALLVWVGGIGIETFRLPFTGTIIYLGPWGGLFTVIWLVGISNLINLIDGVDGLAGGICLMLLAVTAYTGQATADLALLATGMAGALLGFLRFNFPPARIYLGDGGAYFLGFQIGIYSLVNAQKGTILAALVAPLFVLALPIVDTAIAILRRGLRGLPIFRADKRHIHHHLLGMGWSRRRVVLSIYFITAVFMVLGLVAFWSEGKLLPVLTGLAVLLMLILAGQLSFSREWFSVGRVVGNSLEMRQEIQYGLLLSRWLALEGSRCKTLEELWEDLSFVARKLGFDSVMLSLNGKQRKWVAPAVSANQRTLLFEFQSSGAGSLRLVFAADPTDDTEPPMKLGGTPTGGQTSLHEILGELVAEGWLKAMNQWNNNSGRSQLGTAALDALPPGRKVPGLATATDSSAKP